MRATSRPKPRHLARRLSRRRTTLAGIPLAVFVGLCALSFAGTALGASANAGSRTVTRIAPGVLVGRRRVGGMTESQAERIVRSFVRARLDHRIALHVGGRTWVASERQLGLTARPDRAVRAAVRYSRSSPWDARVWRLLTGSRVHRSFSVRFHENPAVLRAFVRRIGDEVGKAPVNAGFVLRAGRPLKQHAHPGRALDIAASRRLVVDAVRHDRSRVRLPMRTVQPAVTDATLGRTILVDVTHNMLYLEDGFHVLRTYPVATARFGFTTPDGTWRVIAKQVNPVWHNPAPNGWGKGEPLVIGPGPDDPIGTRALYLNAPGILIHGTPEDSSIGTYASHGCIRMHISDSEAMYPLVPVGTPVLIYGAPPWGNAGPSGTPGA